MSLGKSQETERWLPRERLADSQCQRLQCFHCHGRRDLPLTLLLLASHRQQGFAQLSTEYGDGQRDNGSSGITKNRSIEQRRTPGSTRKLVPEGSEGFYGEPGAYKATALSCVYEEEALKIQAIVRYTFVYETFSIYHRQMTLLYALL